MNISTLVITAFLLQSCAVLAQSSGIQPADPRYYSESIHSTDFVFKQRQDYTLLNQDGLGKSTYLIDMRQGSLLSQQAQQMGERSYETAYGNKINLTPWYSPKWSDFRVVWMTQINETTGLVWGLSTGEYAKKYKINPGITMGLIHQHHFTENLTMTLYWTYVYGGNLREKSCTADYGSIGGVQEVNCRLAATTLDPAETLQYLARKRSADNVLYVKLNYKF